jgi:pimeloyl-ACP methyl ester carboxylesterase
MRKRGLVAGLTTVITLAMLISGCSSNNAAAMEELRQQYPPPGQMVKVNGLDIHFNVRGEGSLTVVMESGLGENSLTWERVAPIVAQSTRVVVYDRPGQGWSQPTTSPRTIDVFTSELHEALGQAGISGPYILVGQGMGGLAMRLFTQKYPGEVAGLVLIDTPLATEEARYAAVVDTFSTKRSREAIVKSYQDMVKLASNGTLARDTESIPVGKGLPDATRKTYQALVAAYPGYWTMTAAEYENEATDLVQAQQLGGLGDLPLVVISAGQWDPWGVKPDQETQLQAVHDQMQQEIADLSSQGRLVVAENSNSYVQVNQPEVVIQAIRDIMAQAGAG